MYDIRMVVDGHTEDIEDIKSEREAMTIALTAFIKGSPSVQIYRDRRLMADLTRHR